jgi:hypothetical protein
VDEAADAMRVQDVVKRIPGIQKLDNRLVSGHQIEWDWLDGGRVRVRSFTAKDAKDAKEARLETRKSLGCSARVLLRVLGVLGGEALSCRHGG